MPNWELRGCCQHEQIVFSVTIGVFTVVILAVKGIKVHVNEGGATQTRGGACWLIFPAGYLGSSLWGMAMILASTNLLTARIAAGCLGLALLVVLFIAKNWTLRGLCVVLQEMTTVRLLRYVILFIGVMNSLFSVIFKVTRYI